MNNDYASVVKEIEEKLIDIQIDKLLMSRSKTKKKKEVKPEKPKDFTCQISIHQNTKEEIIELPGKPKKEIVELYEEPEKVTHKKKVINMKNS